MAMKHQHPEAFRRMQYRCEKCGQIEWVWNSRDGVTPFVVKSLCCEAFAPHINWQEDQYLPDYEPLPGERFFRNGTLDEAIAAVRRMVSSIPEDIWRKNGVEDFEQYVQEQARDEQDFPPGWPHLETMPQNPSGEWISQNLKAAGFGPVSSP